MGVAYQAPYHSARPDWSVAIKGRDCVCFDEMVRLDTEYIEKQSFLLNLSILTQTPFAILRGKGAHRFNPASFDTTNQLEKMGGIKWMSDSG